MLKAVLIAFCAVVCFAAAFSQSSGRLVAYKDGNLRYVGAEPQRDRIAPRTVGQMFDSGLIYVRTYAGDRGFIAPGSLAKIEGARFVEEGHRPVLGIPLPKQIGGVRVWLGKAECGLRSVSPGFIVFLVPDTSIGWQLLTVQSPLGWHSTLALVLPVAPGIFTNPDGTVQGEAYINASRVMFFVDGAIPNDNTQLRLWCSGIRRAVDVTAFIGFETSMEREPVKMSSHPLFAGIDFALMDLPPEARGDVRIVLFADGFYSNQVVIKVAE